MPRSQVEEYKTIQKATTSRREIEAAVLTQAAMKLKVCQKNWNSNDYLKLDDALTFNQKIWSIFQAELLDESNKLPKKLKLDILSLSAFIDKRTFEVMAYPSPDKLTVLININLNIAAGLRGL